MPLEERANRLAQLRDVTLATRAHHDAFRVLRAHPGRLRRRRGRSCSPRRLKAAGKPAKVVIACMHKLLSNHERHAEIQQRPGILKSLDNKHGCSPISVCPLEHRPEQRPAPSMDSNRPDPRDPSPLPSGSAPEPTLPLSPSPGPRRQNAPKHSASGRGTARKCPDPRPRTRMLDSSRAHQYSTSWQPGRLKSLFPPSSPRTSPELSRAATRCSTR